VTTNVTQPKLPQTDIIQGDLTHAEQSISSAPYVTLQLRNPTKTKITQHDQDRTTFKQKTLNNYSSLYHGIHGNLAYFCTLLMFTVLIAVTVILSILAQPSNNKQFFKYGL
jgi:hypothetical protein